MTTPKSQIVFDEEQARSYDERFAKLAPMRSAVYLAMHLAFLDLPTNARILCVGAGTGAELIYLAEAFPSWQFTVLDPAKPMLDICRARAKAIGIDERCTFHEGLLETLRKGELHDAATSLLVSHFLLSREDRVDFFRQIASRLRSGGLLMTADIASPTPIDSETSQVDLWQRGLVFSGMPEAQAKEFRRKLGSDVAVLPPAEVEAILCDGGFRAPRLLSHTLLMHSWIASKEGGLVGKVVLTNSDDCEGEW